MTGTQPQGAKQRHAAAVQEGAGWWPQCNPIAHARHDAIVVDAPQAQWLCRFSSAKGVLAETSPVRHRQNHLCTCSWRSKTVPCLMRLARAFAAASAASARRCSAAACAWKCARRRRHTRSLQKHITPQWGRRAK